MNKIKEMFRSAQSRYGTYSTLLIAIVIAIVIVVNMVAGQLPGSWKNIDLSDNELYEISAQSKDLLKQLDKEVEIHVLAEKEATDERIRIFMEKYVALSPKLSVKWTDPILHPEVLTDNKVEADTVIISCVETGRSKAVALDEMLNYDQMAYYYSGEFVEIFDAEGELTSAINYVINETNQKIYYTTGHGEFAFSNTVSDLLSKSNYAVEELNTTMGNTIPTDCDLLVIYSPSKDITKEEKEMFSNYMQEGGNVLLLLGNEGESMTNRDALLTEYGLQVANGVVMDYERYYSQLQYQQYAIAPVLELDDRLSEGIKTEMLLLVLAEGMTITDPARDTISVETFMSTSDNAAVVSGDSVNTGKYVLGAIAMENNSRFTVISAYSMIEESIATYASTLENHTLFMNVVNSNFENVSNIAIEEKRLEMKQNTMQNIGIFTLIVIVGIPALVLIVGFIRWLKRRKA